MFYYFWFYFFVCLFLLLGTLTLNHGENIHWKLGIRDNIR